jgi:hypothetical protein
MTSNLWVYSAVLNSVSAVILVLFAFRLTHGAGLKCQMALTRLVHRVVLCGVAWTMLRCALLQLSTRGGPAEDWFYFQIAISIALAVSIYRHLAAPAIPEDASWGRPAHVVIEGPGARA